MQSHQLNYTFNLGFFFQILLPDWSIISQEANSSRLRATLLNPWNSTKQLYCYPSKVCFYDWMSALGEWLTTLFCFTGLLFSSTRCTLTRSGRREPSWASCERRRLFRHLTQSHSEHKKQKQKEIRWVLITHWSTDSLCVSYPLTVSEPVSVLLC